MMCLGEVGGGGLLELSLGDLLGSGVEVAEVEESPEYIVLSILSLLRQPNFTTTLLTVVKAHLA